MDCRIRTLEEFGGLEGQEGLEGFRRVVEGCGGITERLQRTVEGLWECRGAVEGCKGAVEGLLKAVEG